MRTFIRNLMLLAAALVLSAAEAATWLTTGRTDPYDPGVYVSFDPNGGTGSVRVRRLKQAGSFRLPSALFSRPGHVFAGWCGACEDCEEGGDCWHRARDTVQVRGDYTYRAIWKKVWATRAMTYCGYVPDEDGSVGALVFVKAGMPNRRTALSTVKATVLQPLARKHVLKGRTDTGFVELTDGVARLRLELTETSLAGELNGHPVVGAPVMRDVSGDFAFGAQALASDFEGSWQSSPVAVPVQSVHGFWTLPGKTRLRLDKGELDACRQSDNPWGVKLKYGAASGKFTGSFTVFKGMGGGVGLVAGAKCTVTGVMVGDRGLGWALSKTGDLFLVHVQ